MPPRFFDSTPFEQVAGIDREEVLIPTRPTRLFVPPVLTISDGSRVWSTAESMEPAARRWLVWSLKAESAEDDLRVRPLMRAVSYRSNLLNRFTKLRGGEKAVGNLASAYGPLNPLSDEHLAWLRGDLGARLREQQPRSASHLWPRLQPARTEDGRPAVAEPADDWRRVGRVFHAALRLAGELYQVDRDHELPWEKAEALGFNWGGEIGGDEGSIPSVAIDDRGKTITLWGSSEHRKTAALRDFLEWLLNFGLDWYSDESPDLPVLRFKHQYYVGGMAEPYVHVRSLRSALGLQLSFALARASKQVRCAQCGEFFTPFRRISRRPTHHHCKNEACVRAYNAKRKQQQRLVARQRRKDQEPTPNSTP